MWVGCLVNKSPLMALSPLLSAVAESTAAGPAPPNVTLTCAVLVSGGVANLASLNAFRDSLVTSLIQANTNTEFHLFFYVRLPADISKDLLEHELKPIGNSSVWVHRIVLEDEQNTKTESEIRVDHPHYSYSAPFEFNQVRAHRIERQRASHRPLVDVDSGCAS